MIDQIFDTFRQIPPAVALDFTRASVDPRITFARAGATATCVNASGFVEGVAADVARFDFDPVILACRGLLIETSATNQISDSAFQTIAGGGGVDQAQIDAGTIAACTSYRLAGAWAANDCAASFNSGDLVQV